MHLGIDFGTSYTKLGYVSQGRYINLTKAGDIPSLVAYLPEGEKLFFGSAALRLNEPGITQLRFFKLELKRNPGLRLGRFSLADIIKEFFLFLRDEYVLPADEPVESVTVAVPNYFGLRARRIILEAVRHSFAPAPAGLLPEPVAAVLGYNWGQPSPLEGEILCLDIGGGTADFSFVSLSRRHNQITLESQFQIGHDAFSGSELDRGVLRNIFNPLFKMQHGYEIPAAIISEKNLRGEDRYWFNRLMALAEKVKIELGHNDNAYFNIPAFYREYSLMFSLSAELFLTQLEPVFARLRQYVAGQVQERAERLGLYRGGRFTLDYLLLLGGASQTRGIKDLLSNLFPDTAIICPDDLSSNIAQGLSLWKQQGAIPINVKTIYPFNFYIEKREGPVGAVLEQIPFDTANLELDINHSFKIFTLPAQSPYNLAGDEDHLKLRIYELAQGEAKADLNRFMGQDLVFRLEQAMPDRPLLELYLNLAQSRIELEGITPGNEPEDKTPLLRHRHDHMLEYLKLYPGIHPQLLEDYAACLQQFNSRDDSPGCDYYMLLTYKLLGLGELLQS